MKVLVLLFLYALLLMSCHDEMPRSDYGIESPLQNTCQSGDLLDDFPKCLK